MDPNDPLDFPAVAVPALGGRGIAVLAALLAWLSTRALSVRRSRT